MIIAPTERYTPVPASVLCSFWMSLSSFFISFFSALVIEERSIALSELMRDVSISTRSFICTSDNALIFFLESGVISSAWDWKPNMLASTNKHIAQLFEWSFFIGSSDLVIKSDLQGEY